MSLIKNLYKVIKAFPLNEKILITNNYAHGHQWRERLCREFGPVPNVSVRTIEELAYNHAKLTLKKKSHTYIKSGEMYWLIYSLINKLVQKNDVHFDANLLSKGFIDAFYQAVMELRHAGVSSEELTHDQFEQIEKGKFIKQLLHGYEDHLHQNQLVDLPGLLPFISCNQDRKTYQIPVILVHEHIHLSNMEQKILSKITAGSFETLKGDLSFLHPDSEFPVKHNEFFHATGILSELKEVLRRMASVEARLDQVEWIASDYEAYVSAAYALGEKYNLPITFSKGLPIYYSTIGKAANVYLKWIESDFQMDYMLQAFKGHYIQLKKEEKDQISFGKVIYLLEKLGIGWGKERYALIEKASLNENEENKNALLWANTFFKQLLEHLPKNNTNCPKAILEGLTYFLNTYCQIKSPEDASILKSIQDLRTSMSNFDQNNTDVETALDFVKHLLANIRFNVSTVPEPGKIHFSSIHDGGYLGRIHTYLLGMDEINWSVKYRQDPILLDEERKRISSHLEDSQLKQTKKLKEMDCRLGSIRNRCSLSFCSYSPLENEGKQPAYEMLQLYRKKHDIADADMEQLIESMGEPIYFSGTTNQWNSNETEAWLQALFGESKEVKEGKENIFTYYKQIAQGNKALLSRKGTEVTEYDGVLREGLTKEHFESMTYSATQFEYFATCALKFYFRHVLGLKPKEKKEFDRSRWLQAMDRGQLMHSIFYLYITERIASGKIKEAHDRDRILAITEKTLEEYKERIPAPSPHVTQKEIAEIYRDIEVFISQEEKRSSVPKYLELQIHPENGYFEVQLSENIRIPLRGFIDRVDEIEPHVYRIYDYKTGSPKKFEDAKYFGKGTQLQHALYALALEQFLKKGEDPDAVVKEAVYYFPTQKGLGKEVVRRQDRQEVLVDVMKLMLDAIQKGTFLPTEDKIICKFCDFKEVCGEHAVWRKDKLVSDVRFQSVLGVKQYD